MDETSRESRFNLIILPGFRVLSKEWEGLDESSIKAPDPEKPGYYFYADWRCDWVLHHKQPIGFIHKDGTLKPVYDLHDLPSGEGKFTKNPAFGV